jgi:hypothetical protein
MPKDPKKSPNPIGMESGIKLLTDQIDAANHLLANRTLESNAYKAWIDQTKTILIQIYGEDSPNIDTITEASGMAPTWLFMPDDVAEQHTASGLENKRQMLEGCVVALRRKAKQVA